MERLMNRQKKSLLALLMAVVLFLTALPVSAFVDMNTGTGEAYAEGEVLVCVDPTKAPLLRGRSANSILGSYETEELMRLPVEAEGAEEEDQNEFQPFFAPVDTSQRLMLVKSSDESTEEMIESLEQDPTVVYAEPNRYLEMYDVPAYDDPMAAGQWQIKNSTVSNTHKSAEIHMEDAWSATASAAGGTPVVAVVDSGVDYNHPDLKNVMWNEGENYSSLVDMGGGAYGYAPADTDTTDPIDDVIGHGTHCAGIVAAQMNNGTGGVGIAGNVGAKIMAVKILGGDAPAKVDTALRAFSYVLKAKKEENINVVSVNNSWGPVAFDGERQRSLGWATDALGAAGIISCYAAGNDNVDTDLNTGGLVVSNYAVNVGSIDSGGKRSPFSNYGKATVDVMAPGSQILSSVPTLELDPKEGMVGQYLPRYAAASDNYLYENYEGGASSGITYSLLDGNNDPVSMTPVEGNGYQSPKALEIPLAALTQGDSFTVEMSVPGAQLNGAQGLPTIVNMMVGTKGFKTGDVAVISYQNPDDQWQRLGYASTFDSRWINLQVSWNNYPYDTTKALNLRLQFYRIVNDHLEAVGFETTDASPVVSVDDLGVGKTLTPYAYANGTSMASPVVAGIAALVATKYPGETERNIARIKGGVNRDDSAVNGITEASVSMGYVDAAKSVTDKVVPVLNSLSYENGKATLKGYFFGSPGTVTIGGTAVSVDKWEDETIAFTVPDSVTGYQEITVTTNGGQVGRNFFTITPDTVGYTPRAVPNLAYDTETEWGQIHSADLSSMSLVGAGNYLLRTAYAAEIGMVALELYDRTTDEWREVEDPGEIVSADISAAGGATKFYLAYEDDQKGQMLGVYDPAADKWTHQVVLEAPLGCGLAAYGEKLLAIGGLQGREPLAFSKQISVIDPGTGKKMGDFADLPIEMVRPKAEVVGRRLIIHGGFVLNADGDILANTAVFLWDGTSWQEITPDFEALGTDPQQVLDMALGAGTDQLIGVGPVSGLDSSQMVDTWQSDFTKAGWAGMSSDDFRFSRRKTFGGVGQAYGGMFYVLADTGRVEEPLIFRSMPLATTDPTVDPVGVTPPDPSPVDPQPTAQVSGYRTTTGDETPLGLWLALAAAAAVGLGLVVYYRRKAK